MRCDAMDTVQVQSSHTLYVNLVWGEGGRATGGKQDYLTMRDFDNDDMREIEMRETEEI